MITFLVVFSSMFAVVGLMAVGVIAGRKPISGSCGGMGAVGIDSKCDICGGNPNKCDSKTDADAAEASFYDADK